MTSVTPTADSPPSGLTRLRNRLVDALPSPGAALMGAIIWAVIMAASAVGALLLDAWETPRRVREVALLYAAGGALGFPIGLFLGRLLARDRRADTAYAAALVSLTVATVAATGLVYGVHYRLYYAQWHAAPFTLTWALQYFVTVVVAQYQFAVLGLRLYFPFGFLALLAASLWFVRRAR